MIEISESKMDNLAEKVGKALRVMGEVMTCVDEMQNGSEERMGERRGGRGGYRYNNGGYRMPMRQDRNMGGFRDDYDPDMGRYW